MKKVKQILEDLYDAILEDIEETYGGDFEQWIEYGKDVPTGTVEELLQQLYQAVNEDEAMFDKAVGSTYARVEKLYR